MIAHKIFMENVKPKNKETKKQMVLYIIAIGINGNASPPIKSVERKGEANKRVKKEELLSLAINIPENNEIKERPKTATPGLS